MKRRTKRKIKKCVKNNAMVLFLITILPTFLLITVGYGLLKSSITIKGKASLPSDKDEEDINDICQIAITYNIVGSWPDNYVVDITITNNSEANLSTWQLKIPDSGDVAVITSYGNVTEKDNSIYIGSLDWNAKIAMGESQTIQAQFTTTQDIDTVLKSIVIVNCGRADTGEKEEIGEGNVKLELLYGETQLDVKMTLLAAGDWGGQVNRYTLTIVNNTEFDVLDWRGMLYWGNNTTNSGGNTIYEAKLTDTQNEYFLFEDNGGNGQIKSGESLDMNLIIYTNDPNFYPEVVVAGLKAV